MLSLIGRLFSPSPAEQDYSRAQLVLLVVTLAAGAWIRFHGLGNVGLHGDEETMAMPAMAILEGGLPYLPSGMFYSRALAEIYLMSASVLAFGESEWALRLPSAVVGSFTGLAAFFMGRRFLSPSYNLAFVATIVFLPSMIEDSQTARMYVFWVTALMVFAACVFRWERDGRVSSLLLAVATWIVALHFHTLSALAAPLLLFPGLSKQSWRMVGQGAAAAGVAAVLFKLYDDWISASYPDTVEAPLDMVARPPSGFDALMSANRWFVVASVALIAGAGILALLRYRRGGLKHLGPIAVTTLALLAIALLQYHVGGILLMIGVVWWLRAATLARSWLVGSLLLAAIMAAAHFALLASTELYVGRQHIGALVGYVSVWPTLQFFEFAPLAAPLYALAVLVALMRLVEGKTVPVHFLFFGIAVWIPLVVIGVVMWYVELRYTQGVLAYFLMCVFAAASFLLAELARRFPAARSEPIRAGALALITVAIVNPIALASALNPTYADYPDHKGAAEYVRSLEPDPQRIIIAEDILQQTYYLGKVDYWLREIDNAHVFSVIRDGRLVDQYTATEVLGTAAKLLAVFEASENRDVYIIGSGEDFAEGVRLFRGRGIDEVLESDLLEVVYEGRDRKTKVWKLAR